jgi:hypothetical protein
MPDLTGADRAIFDDLASGGAAKKPFPQFIPYPPTNSGGKPANAMNSNA